MTTWEAQITGKSEVSSSGELTYSFILLRDAIQVNGELSVTAAPTVIQDQIAEKVRAFAEAYEAAEGLPVVGDVLTIAL